LAATVHTPWVDKSNGDVDKSFNNAHQLNGLSNSPLYLYNLQPTIILPSQPVVYTIPSRKVVN